MTAQQIADKMIMALNYDNNMFDAGGTGFVVTDDQMARLVAGIEKMGLPGKPIDVVEENITQLTCGEETERAAQYARVEGYWEIDLVLDEIFEG
jgi:hypothetical protein